MLRNLTFVFLLLLIVAAAYSVMIETSSPVIADESGDAEEEENPLTQNLGCYVCHMTYVSEPLATVHAKNGVGCVKCHGTSADHANDEDIGATKPEIYFADRDKIDPSCRKCHETHNAPPEKIVARFIEREISATELDDLNCTGCHGMHRIERAAEEAEANDGDDT